ncbi:MAG: DUF1501 domain-containing protein [Acidobacteria bacterium]|nr:DUF1501 domain-containing protein [Acidobacteriota bacterium]
MPKYPKTVSEMLPTRRDLLEFGGLGLAGAAVQGLWPLSVSASSSKKVTPRGNARNVIFFEISGAISHIDSFDFKENPATPKESDVRTLKNGVHLPHYLFPRTAKVMDRVALLRSLRTHEQVHFRGQYYVQTGRQMNFAFAREIPAVGSVIAAELDSRRREADTFPSYISFNLEKGAAGALATGFLPPRFSVFDLNPEQSLKGMALDQKAIELVEERWRLLEALRKSEEKRVAGYGIQMKTYENFSDTAHRLISDPRWPAAFQVSAEDKKRYGANSLGLSCALARNVLNQDGGTHYIHICHPGWDHHGKIWDRTASSNHFIQIAEFDPAYASLIEDLASTPSKHEPGKTLLDETLVIAMSEFGRTTGALNHLQGRDHHHHCFPALFAGAGVKGGLVLGATNKDGSRCVETGWKHAKEQPKIENVVATMYSALGIDWTKEVHNLPSGRTYSYVDPLGANGFIPTDEIPTIYG